MKINFKEYFKLSLIYTVISALPSLFQTLAQPFIVGEGKLNAVDFSKLAITEIITSFVFVVATYAMGTAISRFYYDYIDNKKGYNKLVSGVFNSIILRGLLLLILAFIAGDYIGKFFTQSDLKNFSSYSFASIILGINRALCLTAFALYRNEKKVLRFVIFNVSLAILRTTFQLLGLFFYEMSFIGYLYGSCVGSGITTIAILAYTYYHSGFHFNLKFLKPLNDFARPIFLYGLIAWGLMYAGRFFLEHYPKELGIYYTAINFALGIQLVLQGIQGATQPEIYRFMKAGTNEHTNEIKQLCNLLLAQTQLFIAIAIVPTMLYLALFYKSDVSEASNYITIIFVDYIIKTQIIIFSYPIYYLKKTKFLFITNSSVLILNLLLNYMLAPVFFIYGLIISTLLSDIILCLSIYFYQNKIIKIKWNYNKLLLFPFILILVISATELIKNLFNINQFITALISVLFIFTSNIILYKNELNKFIKKFI